MSNTWFLQLIVFYSGEGALGTFQIEVQHILSKQMKMTFDEREQLV